MCRFAQLRVYEVLIDVAGSLFDFASNAPPMCDIVEVLRNSLYCIQAVGLPSLMSLHSIML